jgi:hypothetical protein
MITVRSEIVINNQTIQQVKNFNHLHCNLSYNSDKNSQNKLFRDQHMCGIPKKILINKTRKNLQLKMHIVMAAPDLLYKCKNWALNKTNKKY